MLSTAVSHAELPPGCQAELDHALAAVRELVDARLRKGCLARLSPTVLAALQGGKMLRARLAARLVPHTPAPPDEVLVAAAAVEMVHAGSLLHDDVMDGGAVRRGAPTFWQRFGASGAILAGDLLYCEALTLLSELGRGLPLVRRFTEKVRDMCDAETEQEIFLRGRHLSVAQCLDIARRKTGPLFAFAAEVCGGGDAALASALEDAGYHIGTAYQLADDLLDLIGDERAAGKTLGTDVKRRKCTLARATDGGQCAARAWISRCCGCALGSLAPWPEVRGAVERFLAWDLEPVLTSCAAKRRPVMNSDG